MHVALILGHPVKEAVEWKVCASGADEEDDPQRDCIINTLLNHSYANVFFEKRVYNTVITKRKFTSDDTSGRKYSKHSHIVAI